MTEKLKKNKRQAMKFYILTYFTIDETIRMKKKDSLVEKDGMFPESDLGRMQEVLVRHARKSLWLLEPNQIK